MPAITMSLDSGESHPWNPACIKLFFSDSSLKDPRSEVVACSEADCTEFAKRILETEDVVHVDYQGIQSFTLISRSKGKVVQFRKTPLDEDMLVLADKIYVDLPRKLTYRNGFPLPVYISDVVRGVHLITTNRSSDDFVFETQRQTITNLARFITRALHFPG
ncbi:hypothetical protein K461DRAFT_112068 [Myriangium duriaei CBS 260.36]|uniref:Uncharacterized protein n=1 Tax=Myriangium duriaei CBS 260.36 TaxID=1168546 RepID=A0A9P4J648_9PEZI|nr:hypothetical protein K461DRAFT_112068 [Myriangium duriaei CBS 260.36]